MLTREEIKKIDWTNVDPFNEDTHTKLYNSISEYHQLAFGYKSLGELARDMFDDLTFEEIIFVTQAWKDMYKR